VPVCTDAEPCHEGAFGVSNLNDIRPRKPIPAKGIANSEVAAYHDTFEKSEHSNCCSDAPDDPAECSGAICASPPCDASNHKEDGGSIKVAEWRTDPYDRPGVFADVSLVSRRVFGHGETLREIAKRLVRRSHSRRYVAT
jgi:hypothetical protein